MYEQKFHSGDLSKMRFLVTGGAGFIGSHLVEYLLKHGAGKVRAFDNFFNGFRRNVDLFRGHPAFEFMEGDLIDAEACSKACESIDIVLHQAAVGSVPRSIKEPLLSHHANVTGFLHILNAARLHGVKRMVYASSSSVYGDHPVLPKVEQETGNLLSPYAATKKINELYADVFGRVYGMELIGLRYFNVFGPRQDPKGAYAAVIPLFIQAIIDQQAPTINGDGSQTRDFTFVENAVQANIKAAFTDNPEALGKVYNVAVGEKLSLNELFDLLKELSGSKLKPNYGPGRSGDIQNSLADIGLAQQLIGYQPAVAAKEGLKHTLEWYKTHQDFIEK